MFRNEIDRFFSKIEWRWSLANMLWGTGALASATLPAWAVSAMEIFSQYAPLSWIAAGFVGFIVFCVGFLVYSKAHQIYVRSRFNARSISSGAYVDPMAKMFERKRIFLSDFCLPSSQVINDKNFVDCEIIGPANLYLAYGNKADEPVLPKCDATVLFPGAKFFNGITLIDCNFRRCSFQRVTFFVSDAEYPLVKNLDWLNWICYLPDSQLPLLANDQQDGQNVSPSLPGTGTETPP
ncbi:MAG: hypothetical protein ISP41_14085 [Alphaproteobacteria bacterium]|jgi:hypothetical protein|nr:hypothetical protein [Alphaproteobacteria bacterium]